MTGELKQVVSNLISNAADAVALGGTIWVELECVETGAGKSVKLMVADDGPGVAAEHRERIFEPFYTTKKEVGTGLGLWVTKEIVSRHGGRIAVGPSVEPGESGTVFTVDLPCGLTFTGAENVVER